MVLPSNSRNNSCSNIQRKRTRRQTKMATSKRAGGISVSSSSVKNDTSVDMDLCPAKGIFFDPSYHPEMNIQCTNHCFAPTYVGTLPHLTLSVA